jgi:peroxiredoxin
MKKIIFIFIFVSLSVSSVFADILKLRTISNDIIDIKINDKNWIFNDKKHKNKNVLLFFFGTLCPYCIKELPELKDLSQRYKEFKIIGIHAQHKIDDKNLKEFIKKKDITFDVLSFDDGMRIVSILDKKKMWIGAVPFNILLNKQGILHVVDDFGIEKVLVEQIYAKKTKYILVDKNSTSKLIDPSIIKLNIVDKNGSLIPVDDSKFVLTMETNSTDVKFLKISEIKFKVVDKNITKKSEESSKE